MNMNAIACPRCDQRRWSPKSFILGNYTLDLFVTCAYGLEGRITVTSDNGPGIQSAFAILDTSKDRRQTTIDFAEPERSPTASS